MVRLGSNDNKNNPLIFFAALRGSRSYEVGFATVLGVFQPDSDFFLKAFIYLFI